MTSRSKRLATLVVASLAVAIAANTATVAQAFPNKTSACSGCHDRNTNVVVTATQTSNDGVNATYAISVSNAFGDGVTGWAVFDGATNIRNQYNAGTATVAVGKSYTVWGAAGAGGAGSGSVVISPVAPPPPADTIPPLVSIITPTDGSTVSGLVGITATASDAMSGVARVEFKVDGLLVGTDATVPYAGTWNSSAAAAGIHVIEATAYDNAGLSSVSSVLVSIAAPPPPPVDTIAPVVNLTSPTDGTTVAGLVGITATASDAMSGVARVEFRVDGTLVGTDASAPYAGTWNSSAAAAGEYVIQATAYDNAGLSSVSSVLVSIAAPPPPPVAVTSTLTVSVTNQSGTPVGGAKLVLKNVTTGVRFNAVTSLVGSAEFTKLPYGDYTVLASGRGFKRATAKITLDSPAESLAVVLLAR